MTIDASSATGTAIPAGKIDERVLGDDGNNGERHLPASADDNVINVVDGGKAGGGGGSDNSGDDDDKDDDDE